MLHGAQAIRLLLALEMLVTTQQTLNDIRGTSLRTTLECVRAPERWSFSV
jgi:hypothetical protein